jgi:hypothetical protein
MYRLGKATSVFQKGYMAVGCELEIVLLFLIS